MVKKWAYSVTICLGLLVLWFFLPTTAKAVERYEVIQYGDKDDYVLKLQKELYARGYMETEPTGYFGVETQKAVSRYQERHGLESDGKAGPVTQQKIYGKWYEPIPSSREVKETKSDQKASASKNSADSIRLGDEGSTVTQIQKRLKELGYYTYRKTTSYYGEITEAAVLDFQAQNGLTADGVYGKRTKKLLFSDKAKKADASKSKSNKSAGALKQSTKGQSKATSAIELGQSLIGKKYRTGGTGPNTFDCSGFVYYVLKAVGVSTPRTSSEMSKYSSWQKIESKSDLQKGDLVFFSSPGKTTGVGHVGIYLGNNKFIHSTSGSAYGVTISSLSGGYSTRYQWGRRCFK